MTPKTKVETTSKTKSDEVKPQPSSATPAVAPTTPAPAVATTLGATKQQMTLATLKTKWAERGINVEKLEQRQDGKFLLVNLNGCTVKIGPTGGIDLPQIRSYAKAFDAAVVADELLKKQNDRDAKKTATPETPKKEAAKPEAKKTPAAKKAAAHEKIEQQLQA